MKERHIILAAGGAWLDPGRRALDELIAGLTGKDRPRVCCLPTAAGDAAEVKLNFYASLGGRAETTHLDLFDRRVADLHSFLLSQDAIHVSGGNTANALAVWRVQGVDEILREAWEAGVVLTGPSAGMICWFECSVTDSFGGLAPLHDGLGFLAGSACPHYDGEPERRPVFTRLVADDFPAGVAADDGVALWYRGTELAEAVSWRPGARAYRVGPDGETPLEPRLLA